LIGVPTKSIGIPLILTGIALITGEPGIKLIGVALNLPDLGIKPGVLLTKSIDLALISVGVAITSVVVDQF